MKIDRQGDLGFTPIKEKPANTQEVKPINGQYILAYGEKTGHKHYIVADRKDASFKLYKHEKGGFILEVGEPVTLYHGFGNPAEDSVNSKTHAPLKFDKGIYFGEVQVEFDESTEVRKVQD